MDKQEQLGFKCTDILEYLKQKHYQIYYLQDTHFTRGTDEKLVRARWCNDCYFSSFKSNSRGVAILFDNNFDYKVHSFISDSNGNYLILDVTIDNNRIILATVYGPNQDDVSFY